MSGARADVKHGSNVDPRRERERERGTSVYLTMLVVTWIPARRRMCGT